MESPSKSERAHHLAGIVPIAAPPLEFKMPWHDCLMPIGPDFAAVERAVFQCALAGCKTIWVVAHAGTQPLIKKRVGELIKDPGRMITGPSAFKTVKEVQIYYIQINPKDKSKRDCLGWSALYGADSVVKVAKKISKWYIPEKFFVSTPYGIVPNESLLRNRDLLASKTNVSYAYQGKTVKDDIHAPFTFDWVDYLKCKEDLTVQLAQRWKGNMIRRLPLSKVFQSLSPVRRTNIDLPWFHDISTWDGYKNYMASPECGLYEKPKTLFVRSYRRERYRPPGEG